MQTERKAKQNTKFFAFFPEVPPIFGEAKDSANRAESKAKHEVFYHELTDLSHPYIILNNSILL